MPAIVLTNSHTSSHLSHLIMRYCGTTTCPLFGNFMYHVIMYLIFMHTANVCVPLSIISVCTGLPFCCIHSFSFMSHYYLLNKCRVGIVHCCSFVSRNLSYATVLPLSRGTDLFVEAGPQCRIDKDLDPYLPRLHGHSREPACLPALPCPVPLWCPGLYGGRLYGIQTAESP